jgi:N4-(beta-N-acetylglucosaminyl)-L-asparaginase
MDHLGNAGSVTFLEGIMHPISVARAVMEKTPHVMLSGAGALKFALDQGFKKQNLLTPGSKKAWEEWKKESKYKPIINIENHDTIGLLGIGKAGEIAGACSTSGLAYKMHGRVGDSPIIGGAVFCDDEVGGACATGLGEFVMKTLGSFLIVEFMRQGMSPQKACEEAIMRIVKRYKYQDFQVGYLALNKKGEYGAYSIQKGFNFTITKNGVTQVIESASYMS